MNRVHAGFRCTFLTFLRAVFSDIRRVPSSSARNHTSVS